MAFLILKDNDFYYKILGSPSSIGSSTYFREDFIANSSCLYLFSIAIFHNPIPINNFKNRFANRNNNPNFSKVLPAPDSKYVDPA